MSQEAMIGSSTSKTAPVPSGKRTSELLLRSKLPPLPWVNVTVGEGRYQQLLSEPVRHQNRMRNSGAQPKLRHSAVERFWGVLLHKVNPPERSQEACYTPMLNELRNASFWADDCFARAGILR